MEASSRPRERLVSGGVGVLSDAELVALVLQQGLPGEDVVSLSHRLLSSFGLAGLSKAVVEELQAVRGLGLAKASALVACFELGRRVKARRNARRALRSPADVYAFSWPLLQSYEKEAVLVLLLDAGNKVVKWEVVSVGTLTSSLIHPREVFRRAVRENVHSVIIVHNHPSGEVEPSDEDLQVCKVLEKAGNVMGVRMLDFVIVGEGRVWSWKKG